MKSNSIFTLFICGLLAFVLSESTAEARKGKKMSSAEAKKICLESNPELAGKDLRRCIKEKKKSN